MAGGRPIPPGKRGEPNFKTPRPPSAQSKALVPFGAPYTRSAALGRAKKVTYTSAKYLFRTAVVLAVLGVLGFGALYARLTHSPMSMSFLLPPIEKAVNRALSGHHFDIGDAVLRRSDSGFGMEFRLTAVRLLENGGNPVVESPFASASVSMKALLTGQLAAGRIELIGPRLFLQYSEERGLALSFADPREAKGDINNAGPGQGGSTIPAPAPPLPDAAAEPGAAPLPNSVIRQARGRAVNLTHAFNDIFAASRRGESAFLTGFDIRDATVFFDRGDQITRWSVPSVEIDLEHRGKNSAVVGKVAVESTADAFTVDFQVAQNRGTGELDLKLAVDDVVPRTLGAEFPAFRLPQMWNTPVSLAADLELGGNGDILGADIRASLKQGTIFPLWDERHPVEVDSGALHLSYFREEGIIRLTQSELAWGGSRVKMRGMAQRQKETGHWAFQFGADELLLGAEQFGIPVIPLDQMLAQGEFDPRAGAIQLDRFFLRAADAEINLSGSIIQGRTSPAIKLTGQVSPMPVAFFKLIWPKFIAHGAWHWIGTRVPQGRIAGGSLKVDIGKGVLASLPAGGQLPPGAVEFRLDLEDLEVHYIKNMLPLHAKTATATVAGHRFFFNVPEAQIILPSNERVNFTDGQFIIGDIRPRVPAGEIHFKSEAKAAQVLELLDQPSLGYVSALGLKLPPIDAAVTTTFSISLPLLYELKFKDMKLNGRAKLASIRANDLPGGLSVKGGELDFDITEKAIEARGELKANEMPVQVAWQRIFDAPADRQPPLRLRTVLTEAGRKTLGIDINHVLRGDVACELTVNFRKGASPQMHFEANLTQADLLMASLGWRKPPGQQAALMLDMQQSEKGGLELTNINLQGDDLAVRGGLTLDDDHQPTAFNFPVVSLNLQTQMELSGELNRNLWQIRGRGRSYDGRQFFRALFSAGKIAEDQPQLPKDAPGVDMKVEIDNVIGFFDTNLTGVTIDAKRRNNKLTSLDVHGQLNGKSPLAARVESRKGEGRHLLAEATDAGSAFRLVGFYPSARGGEVSLKVNLDGSGAAEKVGVLYARDFVIANDQVIGEVLSGAANKRAPSPAQPQYSDQLQFDRMRVPFSVGGGMFMLHDAAINGPLLGATMRGSIDFKRDRINLVGTYVPLYGLNGAIGAVPILGDLLVSRSGEGLFGITFAVKGPNSQPDVLVNPMSMVAPGFLRQLFEFDQDVPHVLPPEQRGGNRSGARATGAPPVVR